MTQTLNRQHLEPTSESRRHGPLLAGVGDLNLSLLAFGAAGWRRVHSLYINCSK